MRRVRNNRRVKDFDLYIIKTRLSDTFENCVYYSIIIIKVWVPLVIERVFGEVSRILSQFILRFNIEDAAAFTFLGANFSN